MTTQQQTKKNDHALAGEVAKAVNLEYVVLEEIAATHSHDELLNTPEVAFKMVPATAFKLDRERKRLDVRVKFTITGHVGPAQPVDDAAALFELRCVFIVGYSMETIPDVSEEHFSKFAQLNGLFNAWPYCRETAHSISAKMGIPPILLPLFKVGQKLK